MKTSSYGLTAKPECRDATPGEQIASRPPAAAAGQRVDERARLPLTGRKWIAHRVFADR